MTSRNPHHGCEPASHDRRADGEAQNTVGHEKRQEHKHDYESNEQPLVPSQTLGKS